MLSQHLFLSVACAIALAGCASVAEVEISPEKALDSLKYTGQGELEESASTLSRATNALKITLKVCVDYGCDIQRTARIHEAEWNEIKSILLEADSPDSERNAVAKVVGYLEQIVGEQVGTAQDLTKNTEPDGGPGHLDCISESLNTERYLRELAKASLLRWHHVDLRTSRASLIINPHWTAVLKQTDSGQAFAVDSWYGANGQRSFIVELDKWQRGASP